MTRPVLWFALGMTTMLALLVGGVVAIRFALAETQLRIASDGDIDIRLVELRLGGPATPQPNINANIQTPQPSSGINSTANNGTVSSAQEQDAAHGAMDGNAVEENEPPESNLVKTRQSLKERYGGIRDALQQLYDGVLGLPLPTEEAEPIPTATRLGIIRASSTPRTVPVVIASATTMPSPSPQPTQVFALPATEPAPIASPTPKPAHVLPTRTPKPAIHVPTRVPTEVPSTPVVMHPTAIALPTQPPAQPPIQPPAPPTVGPPTEPPKPTRQPAPTRFPTRVVPMPSPLPPQPTSKPTEPPEHEETPVVPTSVAATPVAPTSAPPQPTPEPTHAPEQHETPQPETEHTKVPHVEATESHPTEAPHREDEKTPEAPHIDNTPQPERTKDHSHD